MGSLQDNIEMIPKKQIIEELGSEERARILRKIDWHLLPYVTLFYLLAFLDRVNIGNAKVAGMSTNLNLIGLRYNIAAAVFFIPYSFAEVPSNIALKLFRPSRWIPTLMVAWGLVMTLMCLVNSFQSLIVARVFLGLTEAGLFPGVNYYICLWYPRSERSKRIAIFFSAASMAGAFGGLLAYGIERMEGIGGLHGWQWIFCLEGMATVLVACVSFFFMHDYPETAKFLTEPERLYIVNMLKQDANNLSTRFRTQFILQAMKDYKTYVQIIIYMGLLVPGYAIALFTPTIINELGYSAANAQLLSVPPFVAGCIATIIVGIYSDKHKLRGPYIIGCTLVALVGYILLYTNYRAGPSYAGACLAAMGNYPTVAIALAWAGSNAGGDLKRGVVLAMVIGVGNLGGICSSFIYIDPPRFHIGHGTVMGFLSLAIITSLFAMWNYNRLNEKKEAQCLAKNITDDRGHAFEDMGDASPLFRWAPRLVRGATLTDGYARYAI
ncbi:major facilitator superfamily domain-containing protein [Suillus paluster]|uniref:major facilitator superfamily domain-containing protein n=1 Tax=Suillus paluster TaxID=48578 RepID=UPI001B87E136|nr:major facilitator superfamily domain-containing protein [Suillus paluster]KAG1738423.1 major facilitator superfamily domain-containing protein [Suillus paluster]